jgi:hypothetical protein
MTWQELSERIQRLPEEEKGRQASVFMQQTGLKALITDLIPAGEAVEDGEGYCLWYDRRADVT